MSLGHNPKIVTNGLVFAYDTHWNEHFFSKSYKGKPTVNFAWSTNPRIDSSYAKYNATASGTWTSKHPKAIRVYNKAGSEITGYVNTGVGDWTNQYHGVWEWDNDLARPVVVMKNLGVSVWKAKTFGVTTFSGMGLGYGDTYTISWLQWTDNIGRSARAGVYGLNTSSTNGFHDGQSNSKGASAYNTKLYTWQRVYATFTVSGSQNLTAGRSCYMYGHYNGLGILKVADVQIETGGPSAFISENSESNSTRSSTEVLLDLTGNNTITASNLSYNADGTFEFDGTNDYISIPYSPSNNTQLTVDVWTKPSNTTQSTTLMSEWGSSTLGNFKWLLFLNWFAQGNLYFLVGNSAGTGYSTHSISHGLSTSSYINYTITYSSGAVNMYKNGELILNTSSPNTTLKSVTTSLAVGCDYDQGSVDTPGRFYNGQIPLSKLYNRALTDQEVQQNFNALRGRYGL